MDYQYTYTYINMIHTYKCEKAGIVHIIEFEKKKRKEGKVGEKNCTRFSFRFELGFIFFKFFNLNIINIPVSFPSLPSIHPIHPSFLFFFTFFFPFLSSIYSDLFPPCQFTASSYCIVCARGSLSLSLSLSSAP